MARYDYYCPANDCTVEVVHRMGEKLKTWGEVCEAAGVALGDTPADAPVSIRINLPNISVPIGDSKYKEMGFTKLVRKDTGVYENVTALDTEKRYMKADDPSSMPNLKKRIGD
jgi:hypothetical protein